MYTINISNIISSVQCSTLEIHQHHDSGHVVVATADVGGGVGDWGGGTDGGGGAMAAGHTVAAEHGGVVLRWCDEWRPTAAMLPAAVAAYTIAWW